MNPMRHERSLPSTACCCSTSRSACRATMPCRRPSACSVREKAGHTGTLDPLASGLLPLCFGAATKFSQVSLDADKRYTATLHLGADHDHGRPRRRGGRAASGDRGPRGHRRRHGCASPARSTRCPPMHSALKHEGARSTNTRVQGIEIEREPRRITISRITVTRVARGRRWCSTCVQQGHLYAHAGRRHRRGARLRCASGSPAPHRPAGRSQSMRPSRWMHLAALPRPSATLGCCRPMPCLRTGPQFRLPAR